MKSWPECKKLGDTVLPLWQKLVQEKTKIDDEAKAAKKVAENEAKAKAESAPTEKQPPDGAAAKVAQQDGSGKKATGVAHYCSYSTE